ncbi:MAG: hypothetical protein IKT46_09295 [Clostridia bacterium]|nr:hypothetical protein [Clostridia bacterium]
MDWESMLFDNVGRKIQNVAKGIMCLDIIASFLGGIAMFFVALINFEELWYYILLAPVTVIIGCVAAWLSALPIYGFGRLIENTEDICDQNRVLMKNTAPQSTPAPDKTVTSQKNEYFKKPEEVKKAAAKPKVNSYEDKIWVCGRCGSKNLSTNESCWSCANPK